MSGLIKKVVVIGGYGGVGKALVRVLVANTNLHITIGGRDSEKAHLLKREILEEHPDAMVAHTYVDARNKASLIESFRKVDLAIITATVPESMGLIAEAALETKTDVIDILIRGDVVTTLKTYGQNIKDHQRIFITQSGFHPGLIAPLIRLGASYFDDYQEAKVVMAMEGVFEGPASVREIIHEVINPSAQILEEGTWRKATYKDSVRVMFLKHFGLKVCYPIQMREIIGIDKRLGLQSCGAYASGFNAYVDKFVFPLATVLAVLSKRLSERICSWLFFQGVTSKTTLEPKVELILNASGLKNGKAKRIRISLTADDSFKLTAKAVMALLKQYQEHYFKRPGVYLMGKAVNETVLFKDIENMGMALAVEEL